MERVKRAFKEGVADARDGEGCVEGQVQSRLSPQRHIHLLRVLPYGQAGRRDGVKLAA